MTASWNALVISTRPRLNQYWSTPWTQPWLPMEMFHGATHGRKRARRNIDHGTVHGSMVCTMIYSMDRGLVHGAPCSMPFMSPWSRRCQRGRFVYWSTHKTFSSMVSAVVTHGVFHGKYGKYDDIFHALLKMVHVT